MSLRKYQNSVCKGTWLHNFEILKQTQAGILERCKRCGLPKHFPNQIPNHLYLSWHIRQALQVNDPMFLREYPEALKN